MKPFTIIVFCFASLLCLAQKDTISSYKMGLDDLSEIEDFTSIKVTTASKTAENISDAPSVITVITHVKKLMLMVLILYMKY